MKAVRPFEQRRDVAKQHARLGKAGNRPDECLDVDVLHHPVLPCAVHGLERAAAGGDRPIRQQKTDIASAARHGKYGSAEFARDSLMLTFFDYLPSQNALKVRLLLNHLQIPHETRMVSIFEGEGKT